MEDYVQFSAKTKSEAITKACIELGTSSDQLDIQVVSEGSSGFFGIGSKPAIIKVRKIETVSDEEEIKEIVDTVKVEAIKEDENRKKAPKPVKKQAPRQEEKKEPKKADLAKEPKEKPVKPAKEKTYKERPVKERQPKETEGTVKERQPKERPVKPSKPVEVITDPQEIKEIEERAIVFLKDVFASMDLGEVEITSKYDTTDGCLEVDFEGW